MDTKQDTFIIARVPKELKARALKHVKTIGTANLSVWVRELIERAVKHSK